MNAEVYKNIKEEIMEVPNAVLYTIFEIVIDEMKYRNLKQDRGLNPDDG